MDPYEQELKLAEAHKIAKAVLRGDTPIFEAAPRLWSALHGTNLAMTEAHLFLNGVASETEDLPFGPVREVWSPEALRRKDVVAAAYESKIRDEFLSVREIVRLTPRGDEETQT